MCRPTCTEVLPATKTSAHRSFTWTPGGEGRGELTVTDKRTHTAYSVVEFAVGKGFTGRAVRLAKRDGEVYCVRVGAGEHDHHCDCAGHAYGRGKACKHVDAVRDVIRNGWLDLPFDRDDDTETTEDVGETAEQVAFAHDDHTTEEFDMTESETTSAARIDAMVTAVADATAPARQFAQDAGQGQAFDSLSLRDYFAAAALQGILSAHTGEVSLPDDKDVAEWSYAAADAMLARRSLRIAS